MAGLVVLGFFGLIFGAILWGQSKKQGSVCIIIAVIFILIACFMSDSSGSSGSSSSPWKNLGVGKREYIKTYNYIKHPGY